jgi:hypothetical protein
MGSRIPIRTATGWASTTIHCLRTVRSARALLPKALKIRTQPLSRTKSEFASCPV